MRLSVNHCAKIESADILIDGITVIAGANDTGKSTVGKILFSVFNAMNDIDSKILDERRREIYAGCRRHINDFSDAGTARDLIYQRSDLVARKIGSKVCALSKEELTDKEITEIVDEMLIRYFSKEVSSNPEYEELVTKCVTSIKAIFDIPNETISREVLTRYFHNVFSGQINSLYGKDKESKVVVEIKGKKIELCFRENKCSDYEAQLSVMHKAIYIDNPFVLDSLESFTELNIMDRFLRSWLTVDGERDVMEGIIESVMAKEKLEEINSVLGKVVAGNITKDKADEYYLEDDSFQEPIAFNNLSTGLKAFVLIKMLLEKGILKNKDVLILDEPEIHLHPEWQIAYAELIVLIQKYFDLSIVIATHSPYFVDAINLFSIKYGTDKNVNYYLTAMQESGVRMDRVTDDIERIYQKMASPIQVLDTLRYELNNR